LLGRTRSPVLISFGVVGALQATSHKETTASLRKGVSFVRGCSYLLYSNVRGDELFSVVSSRLCLLVFWGLPLMKKPQVDGRTVVGGRSASWLT
jgi:hypothetical protein